MPVVDVKNLQGKTVGQFELSDAVFGARINQNLLHETVRWYLAWQRAGTHKVKGRGEVSGSGKKLWRQKGTGRARVGSIRSSIWRKGGTVHGPVPRSYAYRLPKKIRLGALRSALSAKLAAEKLTVVDDWALETHKTKAFREVLDRLDGETKTILAGESRRQYQSRARQPESRGREADLAEGSRGVRLAAPRSPGALEASRGAPR
jgi:large subunit ribosomal protein L4